MFDTKQDPQTSGAQQGPDTQAQAGLPTALNSSSDILAAAVDMITPASYPGQSSSVLQLIDQDPEKTAQLNRRENVLKKWLGAEVMADVENLQGSLMLARTVDSLKETMANQAIRIVNELSKDPEKLGKVMAALELLEVDHKELSQLLGSATPKEGQISPADAQAAVTTGAEGSVCKSLTERFLSMEKLRSHVEEHFDKKDVETGDQLRRYMSKGDPNELAQYIATIIPEQRDGHDLMGGLLTLSAMGVAPERLNQMLEKAKDDPENPTVPNVAGIRMIIQAIATGEEFKQEAVSWAKFLEQKGDLNLTPGQNK